MKKQAQWTQSIQDKSEIFIAILAMLAIASFIVLWFILPHSPQSSWIPFYDWPLIVALVVGGIPSVARLIWKAIHGEWSSDILAGISIVTSVALNEYLAGTLVVLMLSGGAALEAYAVKRASSALGALAKRMPAIAHRRAADQTVTDVAISEIQKEDLLLVFPHETCPVDGTVVEGTSTMNESYLTGEPYLLPKATGSLVLSGAINGDGALLIQADKPASDSRYAKIMQVMRESEQSRPQLRRLGDQLGAFYTPLALILALIAWGLSGEANRFLAVLVVATPCPLLIAIPVAIIGSISLAASRGIIIKDPSVLERIDLCTTALFDKTGTLTYGEPRLTEILTIDSYNDQQVLGYVASLERYSRHPLSEAIMKRAAEKNIPLHSVDEAREKAGEGLIGKTQGKTIQITSRKKWLQLHPDQSPLMPSSSAGLECIVIIDSSYAATLRFRDEPRPEGASFINHLKPRHGFKRVLIVSGDRKSEVQYLADQVGITEIYADQTPEQKLALVKAETLKANTVYMGDGINDAPALVAATVGIAFGQGSDVTAAAAGAVILDSSLQRVDELMHLGRRMRKIAMQSAVGGMALSIIGMIAATLGYLPPVAGACLQEVIDVLAVLNALRTSFPPAELSDYEGGGN